MTLMVRPRKERASVCACCGRPTKAVWGDIGTPTQLLAAYSVEWVTGAAAPDHYPHFDLILGPWDTMEQASERFLVSVQLQPGPKGGSYHIVDGESRPGNRPPLCGRALTREKVLAVHLAGQVFELVDLIRRNDPRLGPILALNTA